MNTKMAFRSFKGGGVRRYEIMTLSVIHRRRRTGFEETKDFPIRVNDLIAGRYQVLHTSSTIGFTLINIAGAGDCFSHG